MPSDSRFQQKVRLTGYICTLYNRAKVVRLPRYANLLTIGKLNDYLADLNEQAEAMFSQLVKLLAEMEGVTEVLKAENQMLWVQKMNILRNAATEIVSNGLIYR